MFRIFASFVAVGIVLPLSTMAQRPGDTVPESALTGPTYSLPQNAPPSAAGTPQPGDTIPESALRGPSYALPQNNGGAHAWHPGDDVVEAYVQALQRTLPLHGYKAGPPTGHLDAATEAAIRDYQHDAGLRQDAHDVALLKTTLDHITFSRPPIMRHTGPVSTAAVSPPAPIQPPAGAVVPAAAPAGLTDPDTVRQVQEKLKAKGYDIPVSGTLDIDTLNAIKVFQASNGLPRDGKIDNYLIDLLSR